MSSSGRDTARSHLFVDPREHPGHEHRHADEANDDAHRQHDHGHAKSQANHHHDKAHDHRGHVDEHAFGGQDPRPMPPHFRVRHHSPPLRTPFSRWAEADPPPTIPRTVEPTYVFGFG